MSAHSDGKEVFVNGSSPIPIPDFLADFQDFAVAPEGIMSYPGEVRSCFMFPNGYGAKVVILDGFDYSVTIHTNGDFKGGSLKIQETIDSRDVMVSNCGRIARTYRKEEVVYLLLTISDL